MKVCRQQIVRNERDRASSRYKQTHTYQCKNRHVSNYTLKLLEELGCIDSRRICEVFCEMSSATSKERKIEKKFPDIISDIGNTCKDVHVRNTKLFKKYYLQKDLSNFVVRHTSVS